MPFAVLSVWARCGGWGRAGLGGGWRETCETLPPNTEGRLPAGLGFGNELGCVPVNLECWGQADPELSSPRSLPRGEPQPAPSPTNAEVIVVDEGETVKTVFLLLPPWAFLRALGPFCFPG